MHALIVPLVAATLVSILVAALSGCATPAERAAQKQREVEEMIYVYGPACDKLGYKPDSDKWRDCVLNLAAQDNIARYSRYPTSTTCFGHRGFFQCSSF